MIRADGAVTLCGEVCGQLGTTGVRLRVPVGGIAVTVAPRCHSVDGRGVEISLATGRDRELSTIHRPTTTTKREIERVFAEDGEEGP